MIMVVRISGGASGYIYSPMMISTNANRNYPIRGVPDGVVGNSYRTGPRGWMAHKARRSDDLVAERMPFSQITARVTLTEVRVYLNKSDLVTAPVFPCQHYRPVPIRGLLCDRKNIGSLDANVE